VAALLLLYCHREVPLLVLDALLEPGEKEEHLAQAAVRQGLSLGVT
jgi:hypothetical protein